MPLGSLLPPPPRLSWPGPRCLPRTIMPPTAAGTEIGVVAAAGGRASRGGPKPAASSFGALCTLAGTVSRGTVKLSSRPSPRAYQKSPRCRAVAAFLGMAGRAAGAERAGRRRLGVVLPSFEIKILGSWRNAGGGPGQALLSAAARRRSSSVAHVGFRRGDPAKRHRLATATGADDRGRAAASPAPALGGSGRPQGRGRGWLWGGRS